MTHSVPRAARSSGFTLLEVLISLFVLAVGMLGFASLQGTAAKSNAHGGVQSRAVNIGQARMDALKSARFVDLVENGALDLQCETAVKIKSGAADVDFYTVSCTLAPQDTDADGQDDRVDFQVNVTYPGARAVWPIRLISSRSRR